MNVTLDDIRNIKPGTVQPFVCEDGKKMRSAASLITTIKRTEMPDGVADYEHKKFWADENDGVSIILIHAMRESDPSVFKTNNI